jgi:hypothetical protein
MSVNPPVCAFGAEDPRPRPEGEATFGWNRSTVTTPLYKLYRLPVPAATIWHFKCVPIVLNSTRLNIFRLNRACLNTPTNINGTHINSSCLNILSKYFMKRKWWPIDLVNLFFMIEWLDQKVYRKEVGFKSPWFLSSPPPPKKNINKNPLVPRSGAAALVLI